jgi:hypothetical protein
MQFACKLPRNPLAGFRFAVGINPRKNRILKRQKNGKGDINA